MNFDDVLYKIKVLNKYIINYKSKENFKEISKSISRKFEAKFTITFFNIGLLQQFQRRKKTAQFDYEHENIVDL